MLNIRPGTRVLTRSGEQDSIIVGGKDVEREARAGTWGHITRHNHVDDAGQHHWDAEFEHGVWVVLSEAELRSADYALAEPLTVEQCALALAYGYNQAALTMYDADMIGPAETLSSSHAEILDMLAELARLREQLDVREGS